MTLSRDEVADLYYLGLARTRGNAAKNGRFANLNTKSDDWHDRAVEMLYNAQEQGLDEESIP